MSDFRQLVDRRLGDFRLKSKLGEGGSSVVYIAEQLTLGRDVVVKVLGSAEKDVDASRFLREVRLAAKLDHPYAAHVYAFGAESDGMAWIAMELVRGTPLDRVVQTQGPIPLARLVPFLDRLAEVISAAHDQGIVHRDVKPSNVMVLQRAGRLLPKLLDLGIARTTRDITADAPVDMEPIELLEASTTLDGLSLDGVLLSDIDSLQLTRVGSVVGTPHYMAPEQWRSASTVDGRADVYSLALLAYQCLVGQPPFQGKTVLEIARRHARDLVPKLGPSFPSELDDVIAKGAAKSPKDRYASALEFAAAFRHASGLGIEPAPLPHLPDALRDSFLFAAPQPIAEAVELLDSSRAPRHAREAVAAIATTMSRYLGVLTLAARMRVGPGGKGDRDETSRLLARLRAGRLDDREWLELGAQLTRPFVDRAEAHPIPELVRFFADDETSGVRAARNLLALLDEVRDAGDDASTVVLITKLASMLEAAGFLLDYRLVIWSGEASVWMGTRRAHRVTTMLAATGPSSSTIVLVDAQGLEVLSLDAFAQCLAPSGGAPEELFLLDGEHRNGARFVAWPSSFERYDDRTWSVLEQQGLAMGSPAAALVEVRSPYKGLSTFSTEDADFYFGREREAESFANRLRRANFLAVVGPSGTGKSSFVLAGVLPLLPHGMQPIVFRPSARPFAAWNARLTVAGFSALDERSGQELADQLAVAVPEGETLLFVVDQFEELVTLCPDAAVRDRFAIALLACARHRSGKLRVVVTLRDDFLIAIQQLVPFRETLSSALQLLGTPRPEDLQRVLTEPVRRLGYAFDDETLPARMVAEVADKPGALALLSFTASQLWELRDRQLRLLRGKTYVALGGVGGALANHAESTLSNMSALEVGLAREAFRHLVTAQGTRAVLTKPEAEELLGGAQQARPVIDALVQARLLVSSDAVGGGDALEIIHEALITAWPRLVSWQREDAESVRVRDALRASARQWGERGKPSGLLWRKEALAEYRAWRPRFAGRLTQLESEFATASLRDEARAKRIRRVAVVAVLASLAIGLGVATRSWLVEKRKLVETRQEQARTAMMDGRPMEAIVYADAAERAGGSSAALDQILGAAVAILSGTEHYVGHFDRRLRLLRTSPDGQYTMALGIDQVVLLKTATSTEVARWDVPCGDGAFAPRGGAIWLGCDDNMLRVIDLSTLKVREIRRTEKFAARFEVSPDGKIFAPLVFGDTITAFDWDGHPAFSVTEPHAKTLLLVFSPRGGGALVSGDHTQSAESFDGVIVVDDHGRELSRFASLAAPADEAEFSPDGKLLALGLLDRSVEVLDMDTRRVLWSRNLHHDEIWTLHFNSRGDQILTTGSDGFSHIVDAKTGTSIAMSHGVNGATRDGIWLRGDREVLLGEGDGSIARVDAATGRTVWEYVGHSDGVRAFNLIPGSDDFVSGSIDGDVWRWPVARAAGTTVTADVIGVWSAPWGRVVATATGFRGQLSDVPEIPIEGPQLAQPALALVDFARNGMVAIAFGTDLVVNERRNGVYEVAWRHSFAKAPSSIAVSPDGALVATIDDSGHVDVLDRAGKPAGSLQVDGSGDALITFDSHDQLVILDDSSGDLRIYSTKTWTLAHRTAAHHTGGGLIRGPKLGQFISMSDDRELKVWSDDDWTTPVATLRNLNGLPVYAVPSPDLRFMAVVEASPRVVTYELASGKPLSFVRLRSAATQAAPNPDGTGILAATSTGLVAVPTFATPPSPSRLQTIEECRLSKELSGESLVTRKPICDHDAALK